MGAMSGTSGPKTSFRSFREDAIVRDAVIIEAVRTPVGRRGGALREWHPADLLAVTLRALIDRSRLDPALVDDVICGCVNMVGEQSRNIGRFAWLAAGLPESVPGTTIDRQCGSSQQAAHFAAQGVISGAYDVAVACGVESMSRIPIGAAVANGPGHPFGPMLHARYDGTLVQQGISAELIARKWDVGRAELDAISLASHERAARAADAGYFQREIAALPAHGESAPVHADEGIRRDTSAAKLAALKPAFAEDGVITAGNSSQMSDGAAAVLIVERETAKRLGLRPRARFAGFAVVGDDPVLMLTGPIPATAKVLARSGLRLADIGVFEVNEAFASVTAAWLRETGADPARTNPNGGAIALGHPLGATGARLLTSLVHELERSGRRYGLQAMCEGGGTANATIIERLPGKG